MADLRQQLPSYQPPEAGPADERQTYLPQKAAQLGKTLRPPKPDAGAHWWDEVSYEVLQDVEDDVAWLRDEMLAGTRAPFSANTSEEQKLAYYRSQFFKPDGTPNEVGRKEVLARVGVRGFADVLAALYDDRNAQPFVIEPGSKFYKADKPEMRESVEELPEGGSY